MNRTIWRLVGSCLLIALFFPSSAVRASETSALINELLDRPITLDFDDFLPSVIKVLEDKTGAPIRSDPTVWELLPWGQQTKVTAKIQNQTLRQSLTAITQKLGLQVTLTDEAILLEPMPGLRRLGRRSTQQELEALNVLATTPMPTVTDTSIVRSVLTAIDLRLDVLKAPLAIEDRLDAETRAKTLSLPRGATMMDALEQIAKQTRGTWYPWAKTIVVVPKESQIRDQLAKTFSTRYTNSSVAEVLEDLRRRAGVPLLIEPGALQKISPDSRTVRIFWDNVSVEQALDELRGFTGLDYSVTDEGVRITHAGSATPAGGAADPVMAMIALENGMTLLVRESQVPPELREYLKHRVNKTIDGLRVLAEAEKFAMTLPTTSPVTQPATRPATQPAK